LQKSVKLVALGDNLPDRPALEAVGDVLGDLECLPDRAIGAANSADYEARSGGSRRTTAISGSALPSWRASLRETRAKVSGRISTS